MNLRSAGCFSIPKEPPKPVLPNRQSAGCFCYNTASSVTLRTSP
ncbi:hypothetical protein HMPREF9098_0549 [Kingella denitrificans ATCC 33394]|uniref:Uncharacterized protein n=1 Tax=Kingella denitrificans ATCC 33394 TaxID=888741 RepID=F0EXG6_9NEIS|nr:hypothetical protein HMPREF9098_0549 [Kingella denitrificans ATCC 33394]